MSDEQSEKPRTKNGRTYSPQTLARVVTRFKQLRQNPRLELLEACRMIGEEFDPPIPTNSVYKIVDRFRPTAMLASDFLRSKAFRMAKRLVREADSGQLIDILSRANMGVIAPKSSGEGGNQGFVLSVQADSCGAVRVGMASGMQRELPAATGEDYAETDPWRDERVQSGTAPQRFLQRAEGDEPEAGARHRHLGAGQAEGQAAGRGDTGRQGLETKEERLQRLLASAKARIASKRDAPDPESDGGAGVR
jgi:hypothetical protein